MLICANRNPRETALGNIHELADPSPTFPVEFSPQQKAHRPPLKPHVPLMPALMAWYGPGETTSTVVVSLCPSLVATIDTVPDDTPMTQAFPEGPCSTVAIDELVVLQDTGWKGRTVPAASFVTAVNSIFPV